MTPEEKRQKVQEMIREAEERARASEEEVFVHFAGDDSCEDCQGWNGYSRRCDCGNRRVCWEWGEHRDGEFYLYAEAH